MQDIESNVIEEPKIKLKKNHFFDTTIGFISTSFDLIRSVLIRVFFSIHLLVATSLVCFVRNDLWYMVNAVGIVFIVIEFFIIALKNGGKDLPWFSPSFFLYIATIIPPTWFLELENIRLKLLTLESINNATLVHSSYNHRNFTNGSDNDVNYEFDLGESLVPMTILPGDIKAALAESTHNFAMYVEVSMMLIIIIGRWVMPKKGITRSELSQLLLVYMSLASDIIDLLSVLQEQKIMLSTPMIYCTLTIYSWSLFQFTLNLVVTRGRSTGSAGSLTNSSRSNLNISTTSVNNIDKVRTSVQSITNKKKHNIAIHSELWNVMITLIMQDFPFFILRTVCVFKFDIVSYLFLFFTFKNGILFSLQIYRIIAICTDKDYNYDPSTESIIDSNQGLIHNVNSLAKNLSKSSNENINSINIKNENVVQPHKSDIILLNGEIVNEKFDNKTRIND